MMNVIKTQSINFIFLKMFLFYCYWNGFSDEQKMQTNCGKYKRGYKSRFKSKLSWCFNENYCSQPINAKLFWKSRFVKALEINLNCESCYGIRLESNKRKLLETAAFAGNNTRIILTKAFVTNLWGFCTDNWLTTLNSKECS